MMGKFKPARKNQQLAAQIQDELGEMIAKAFNHCYSKVNCNKHGVMQAEGSDEMCGSDCCPNDGACEHCQNPIRKSAVGAAVGNSAAGQSGSAVKVKTGTIIFCEGEQFVFGFNRKTGKIECFNLYGMSGISDEGALPR